MVTTKGTRFNANQTTRSGQTSVLNDDDKQFFRSFTGREFKELSNIFDEKDVFDKFREEIIRIHGTEDFSFSDGTEDIPVPQGLDLNVNHNVTFPTFKNWFSSKSNSDSGIEVATDDQGVKHVNKNTGVVDYVKNFITQYLDPNKIPWFLQMTSDITILAMLWCWLICWMCKNQFSKIVRLKQQNDGKDYPTLQDRDWEEDLEVANQRLKVWSRRLIVVLTLNIMIRVARSELFTDYTKHLINTIHYVKDMVPNINSEDSKSEEELSTKTPDQDAADRLSAFLKEEEERNPTAQSDFTEHVPYVVIAIVGLCSTLTGLKTKTPLSSTILNFAKVTSNQRDNLCDMLLGAFGCVGSLLKRVSDDNVISNYFYVDKINDAKTEELLSKIKDFVSTSYAGTDVIDPERLNVFTELVKDSKAHMKVLDPKSFDYRMICDGIKELEKQSTNVMAQSKALSGERVETVGVLFMGEPGVKKAVLTDRIAKNVTYATIPEIWKEDFIACPDTFFFNYPNDQFFDSYTYKAWSIFVDDAHQVREVAGMDNPQSFNIIRMINSACFVLKMADITQKNNTFFRSAYLWANTNRTKDTMKNLEGIHDSGAVMRRYHLTVEVSVNSKYSDYLDLPTDKVYLDEYDKNQYIEGTSIPDDYWNLHLVKYNTKSKLYDSVGYITFDELVNLCINQYYKHVQNYYVNKQTSIKSFERLKAQGVVGKPVNGIANSRWYMRPDPAETFLKKKFSETIKPQADTADQEAPLVGMDSIEELLAESDDECESIEPISEHSSEDTSISLDEYPNPVNRSEVVCPKLFAHGVPPAVAVKLNEDDINNLYEPACLQGFLREHELVTGSDFEFPAAAILGSLVEETGAVEYFKGNKDLFVRGAHIYSKTLAARHPIQHNMFKGENDLEDYTAAIYNFDALLGSRNDLLRIPMTVANEWIPMCKRVNRADLADSPGDVVANLLAGTDGSKKLRLLTSFRSESEIMYTVESIMNQRIRDGKDVVTGFKSFSVPQTSKIGSGIWKKIKYKLRQACDFVKENWFAILLIGGVGAGIVYGFYKLFSAVYEMVVPQSVDLTKMTTRHAKTKIKVQNKPNSKNTLTLSSMGLKGANPRAQASFVEEVASKLSKSLTFEAFGAKTNVTDIMSKVVSKYFYIIYLNELTPEGIKCRRFAQCDNVAGRIFHIKFHYIFMLDEMRNREEYLGASLTIINPLKTNSYSVTLEDFLLSFKTTEEAANSDTALFLIPQAQPGTVGTLKYYLTEADYATLMRSTSYTVNIVSSSIQKGKPLHTMTLVNKIAKANSDGILKVEAPWTENDLGEVKYYTLNRNIHVHTGGNNGECGALVFVTEGNFANRCIVGAHTAGTSKDSYASVCTYEVMKSLCDLFTDEVLYTNEEFPTNIEILEEPKPQGNFVATHKFADSDSFVVPKESRIVPSVLQGRLPQPWDKVYHEPMTLKKYIDSEGNVFDPMVGAIKNYGFKFPCVQRDIIADATDDFFDTFDHISGGYQGERRTLTTREALGSYRNINKIASDTSSGYPMNTPGCLDLKEAYYLALNGNLTTPPDPERAEELTEIIEELILGIETKMLEGTRPFFAYADFLKDEIRKTGKTARLISGSPWLLLIIFRKYFGAFLDAFVEYNIEIGSAIGVNPYSMDWDSIGKKFEKFKDPEDEKVKVGAGDFAHLDGSEDAAIHNEMVRGINEWYGFSDGAATKIRRCLFVEITNSRHHFKGLLVQWESSLPSGNPLTAMINTIYTHIAFRCCWIILELPIENFRVAVYLIVLGDDNGFTVHKYYRTMFNEITIAMTMPKIGLIYTTELKVAATVPFRNLDEIEFLKRQWIYDKGEGRYIAPLRMESIANMLNWTKEKQKVSPEMITVENIHNALRELSLHGKTTYNTWYDHLMKLKQTYLGEYKMPFSGSLEYEHMKARVLGSTMFY